MRNAALALKQAPKHTKTTTCALLFAWHSDTGAWLRTWQQFWGGGPTPKKWTFHFLTPTCARGRLISTKIYYKMNLYMMGWTASGCTLCCGYDGYDVLISPAGDLTTKPQLHVQQIIQAFWLSSFKTLYDAMHLLLHELEPNCMVTATVSFMALGNAKAIHKCSQFLALFWYVTWAAVNMRWSPYDTVLLAYDHPLIPEKKKNVL